MSMKSLICWKSVVLFLFGSTIGCTFDTSEGDFRYQASTGGAVRTKSTRQTNNQPTQEKPKQEKVKRVAAPEQPANFNGPKIDPAKPLLPQKGKVVNVGKNVFVQILPGGKRRVLVNAYVCLRRGQLEVFLCRTGTKEHEAVLASRADARIIHAGLVAAKAQPGSPVQFVPKYKPASGTTIKVSVQYKSKKGKIITEPAQKWIRNINTKKEMKYNWVFAGSRFIPAGPNAPPDYAANDGTVICVSNFDVAMLDLPVELSNANNALAYVAWTDRIPALNTPVQVILEPVLMNQKK